MSIDAHPGKMGAAPTTSPNWGELSPEGQTTVTVRFVLSDRIVTYPLTEFRRWEHVLGENEVLTLSAGKEQVVIEGRDLGAVRAALDLGRLCELRLNYTRSTPVRPGPRVLCIAIDPA